MYFIQGTSATYTLYAHETINRLCNYNKMVQVLFDGSGIWTSDLPRLARTLPPLWGFASISSLDVLYSSVGTLESLILLSGWFEEWKSSCHMKLAWALFSGLQQFDTLVGSFVGFLKSWYRVIILIFEAVTPKLDLQTKLLQFDFESICFCQVPLNGYLEI